jgi:hypothetical protein
MRTLERVSSELSMPILNPDFDPDWKARFERAQRRVDATGKPEHLPAMQNAFWSRYRTMAEIRDFHFDAVRRKADAWSLDVTIPHIDDDCTWDDISLVYAHLDDAIDEHIARGGSLPHKNPEGLHAFFPDDSAQIFTEYYQYTGFWDFPSACYLTIEYQENEVHVCFTLIPDSGTSPINMIEELATSIYHDRLAGRYDPEDAKWYTYFRFRGPGGNEGFIQAVLSWHKQRKKYAKVEWRHFSSVPGVIAESADLEMDPQEPLVRLRVIDAHNNKEADERDA